MANRVAATDLLAKIKAAGDAVREAKASSATNAPELVQELLALKTSYKDLTGEDVPGSKPSNKKDKKKKKADVNVSKAPVKKTEASKAKKAGKGAPSKTPEASAAATKPQVTPKANTSAWEIFISESAPSWATVAIESAARIGQQSISVTVDDKRIPFGSVVHLIVDGESIWEVNAVVGFLLNVAGVANPSEPLNLHWLDWLKRNDYSVDKITPPLFKKSQYLKEASPNSAVVIIASIIAVAGKIGSLGDFAKNVVGDVEVQSPPTSKESKSSGRPAASKSVSEKKPRIQYGPRPKADKFYVTTAINYTNGDPHVGHAYEGVCTDVIARYHRVYGRDVYFLTGTDEHGKKIAETATSKGLKPIDICNEYADKFQSLNKRLNISNDFFIRTTQERHKTSAKKLWSICEANGDIYLDNYEGWYNIKEEEFVTDTTAEEMGFKDSSGKPLEKMKEESYFFKMSKYSAALKKHIEENPTFIQPDKRRQDVLMRLNKEDLFDLSVSRSTFTWGVPVPGNEKHVMYVWFDALSNYLTGVDAVLGGDLEKFWPASLHIVGKDITWFHCVIWPCMLMSAGIPLPKRVFGHGFVQDKHGCKMSKTIGNVVDPNSVLDTFGADLVRYFMVKQTPFGGDLKFSESDLILMNNSDLADTLGNLAHRATNLTQKYCGGVVPDVECEGDPVYIEELIHTAEAHMANQELQQMASITMAAFRQLNEYFTIKEPWKIKGKTAEDDKLRQSIVRTVLEGLYVCAHFLLPLIPSKAETLFDKLGTKPTTIVTLSAKYNNLKPGTKVQIGEILFAKLELPEADADADAAAASAESVSGPKSVDSPESTALLEKIAVAGDAVRAAKAAGENVKSKLDILLGLKEEYKTLTGEDVPGAKPSKKKKK